VIRSKSVNSSKQIHNLANRILKIHQSLFYLLVLLILFFLSCSPTKRFTEKDVTPPETLTESVVESKLDFSVIRVSMQGVISSDIISLESSASLFDEQMKLTSLESNSYINCFNRTSQVGIVTENGEFIANKFILRPTETNGVIKLNGKRYRGEIQISVSGSSIDIINVLNLEDYVKGVLSKEMPLGKNEENLEALKALAVCVRTYAIKKMQSGKLYFDIYADTRDQVYGGVDAEQPISNKAAEETENLILKYDDNLATVFYHSTCGG